MIATCQQRPRLTVRNVVLAEPKAPDLHIFSRFALPRLGVVLLGTILRDQGRNVKVLVEEARPFDRETLRHADLVGISAITPTAVRSYALADELRAQGVTVVMGGPHPTHCPDEAMQHADFVVRGEGEEALPALVRALETGSDLARVPNLSYREAGLVRHNPLAPLQRDLDAWPDPDLSLIDGFLAGGIIGNRRIVPLQTSRGCPHDCSFCTVTTTFGRSLRYRSIERVVKEMARHDLERTHFFIYDDNFTANRRRTREMLEAFLTLPRLPHWSAQVRADVARDPGLLDRMVQAGCGTVYLGLESVNPESLRRADKRQQLEEVEQHLARIRARGIALHGMFVFGFDSDGPGTMERTVEFARRHQLFSVQFLLLTPLPGSRLGAEIKAAGRLLHEDWSQYDAHHVVFQPARITPRELQRWQTEGHRRFYSPGQIAGRLWRRDWAGVTVSLYAARLNISWQRRNAAYLRSLGRLDQRRPGRPAAPAALLGEPSAA